MRSCCGWVTATWGQRRTWGRHTQKRETGWPVAQAVRVCHRQDKTRQDRTERNSLSSLVRWPIAYRTGHNWGEKDGAIT